MVRVTTKNTDLSDISKDHTADKNRRFTIRTWIQIKFPLLEGFNNSWRSKKTKELDWCAWNDRIIQMLMSWSQFVGGPICSKTRAVISDTQLNR